MAVAIATRQPRFANVEDAQSYLKANMSSVEKQTVLTSILCSAENMVERYCRRHFAPEPAFDDPDTGYQRRLVSISSPQPYSLAAGTFPVTFMGDTAHLSAADTAAEAQATLDAAWTFGGDPDASVQVTGGPLPSYAISITFGGSLAGVQPEITTVANALGGQYAVVVVDCGFDSAPPVMKAFSTHGRTTVRVPDLRLIDPGTDPTQPQFAGISLRGQRLLTNQYDMGYESVAPGGQYGFGDSLAEPATTIQVVPWLPAAEAFGTVLGYGPWQTQDLQVVGRWGWAAAPADILDAIYRVTARGYRERDAAYSDQMVTAEGVLFQFFKQLPAFAQAALDSYRVPNISLI